MAYKPPTYLDKEELISRAAEIITKACDNDKTAYQSEKWLHDLKWLRTSELIDAWNNKQKSATP